MPTKVLASPADRRGLQDTFNFGGGTNDVFALDDNSVSFGYIINGGGGDDNIFSAGSDDLLIGGSGNDTIFGGGGSDTIYGGDTDGSDGAKGPGGAVTNLLVGDGTFDPVTLVTDGSITVNGTVVAAGDTIVGGNGVINEIYGDHINVTVESGSYTGGNDVLTGGNDGKNTIFGDGDNATVLAGASLTGGNDTITTGTNGFTDAYGDFASVTLGNSTYVGGNDTITGGDESDNSLYGDGFQVVFGADSTAWGGDDVLIGGAVMTGTDSPNFLYGDVIRVLFSTQSGDVFYGGDDTLIAGDGISSLFAGTAVNILYGDAVAIIGEGTFYGGDDRLVAGTSTDHLYGDWTPGRGGSGIAVGGDDTFVFYQGTGTDTVWDFEVAEYDLDGNLVDANDVIELHYAGYSTYDDLSGALGQSGSDVIITLGGDQIILKNVSLAELSDADFAFV